ncbi:hypothetical protein [Streptomyces prasinopilosus]|uniref:Uncharacterized protein n=1 Tax=Streptomyces prasinopilosus TaxID=67344 RepID=A0A1G7AYY1_9ACTN|nr:hypothetical protein [Streptomyces prasinopilosus]SDE19971.1 hypothetical protein SAMN05216505_12050 [Streptomyces prasinopilosus]
MGTENENDTDTGKAAEAESEGMHGRGAEAGPAVDAGNGATEPDPEAEPGTAPEPEARGATAVGQGAAAIISAGLGVVSLTGSWIGTVAAARETLVGQLRTAADSTVATQVEEIYGDAWRTSALWGGLFALTALVIGVVALARPAFGAPGAARAPWIKSVAWAGVALGVLGLLLAVLKYTDVLLGLPATG